MNHVHWNIKHWNSYRDYKAESEEWVQEHLTKGAGSSTSVGMIVVLAGGVDEHGKPHESVLRRLDAAIAIARSASGDIPILCNGGGNIFIFTAPFAIPFFT